MPLGNSVLGMVMEQGDRHGNRCLPGYASALVVNPRGHSDADSLALWFVWANKQRSGSLMCVCLSCICPCVASVHPHCLHRWSWRSRAACDGGADALPAHRQAIGSWPSPVLPSAMPLVPSNSRRVAAGVSAAHICWVSNTDCIVHKLSMARWRLNPATTAAEAGKPRPCGRRDRPPLD